MFKRCLVAENRKLHASPIWIVFFVLPVISAIYGTYNYLQNLGILTDQWYSLWTQHTLFYALFFFPVLVGVYAAYLWRLEHMGHNWNLIMAAPVRPLYLFLAKYVIVLKLVLLTQMLVFALYFFCGKAFAHLPGLPPLETFLYLLRGLAGGQCVIALQLLLSMLIRSFAVPVFIGLAGGVVGMLAASNGAGLAFPYALMQVGMNSNKSEDMLAGSYGGFLLASALWLLLFLVIADLLLRKRDVRS